MRKEYFDELFQGNKTVIIPGLGAFTKNSPADKAVFNPFLKFNDGLLAGFLAQKLGIGVDQAGKQIEENVKRINEALAGNTKVAVAGLGYLQKSPDGKITFAYDVNATADAGTAAPKKEEPVTKENRVVHEIKKDKKPEEKKTPLPVVEEKKKPEPPKEEKKPVPPVVKDEKKAPAPETKKPVKEKPPRKEKNKDGKKKKIPWVLIIVVLLLGGAGTFTLVKWDMVKGWFAKNEKVEEKNPEEVAEEPVKDTTTVVEAPVDTAAVETTPEVTQNTNPVKEEVPAVKKEVKKTPPPVQNSFGDYHVIVNCYSQEYNAQNMMAVLQGKGYSPENMGTRGGLIVISAGSASSMEQAKSLLDRVRGDYPKAWIYTGK